MCMSPRTHNLLESCIPLKSLAPLRQEVAEVIRERKLLDGGAGVLGNYELCSMTVCI